MKGKWILLLGLAVLSWWFFLQEDRADFIIPAENGSIKVFFCPQDLCEQVLVKELEEAKAVQCAIYSLKLPNVTRILQGKSADVLIDEDNYDGFGQKVVMSGLMHNKFCVWGGRGVWTGSLNPTYNGAYKENNNLILVHSKLLAENYAAKFLDIKQGKKRGVLYQKILLNGFLVENYFCPEDDCEDHVLKVLKTAKKSIYFLTYSFTSDEIGDLLVASKDRLEIRGVMEKSQVSKYSEFNKFNASGMAVKLDRNPSNLHHKLFIVDNETVITGSYNPTAGGNQKNRENVLILNDPNVAHQFVEEFERIWKNS